MCAVFTCVSRANLMIFFGSLYLLPHYTSVSALPSPTCLGQLRPVRNEEILGSRPPSLISATLNGQCDARKAGVRPCKSKHRKPQPASKKNVAALATLESSVSTSPHSISECHGDRSRKSGANPVTETESDLSEAAEIASLTEKLLHLSPQDGSSSPLHSSWDDSETTRELFVDGKKNRGGVSSPLHIPSSPTEEPAPIPLPREEEGNQDTSKAKAEKRPAKKSRSSSTQSGKQKPGKLRSSSSAEKTSGSKQLTPAEGDGDVSCEAIEKSTALHAKSETSLHLAGEKAETLSAKTPVLNSDEVVWPRWQHGLGKTCRIVVDGNPIALKRPRHRMGGHTYDPNYRDKKMFLAGCEDQLPSEPWAGAMALSLTFELPRPKLHFSKAKKTFGQLKASVPPLPCTVPDLDNLVKFVLDALNEKLYQDDRQICEITARKVYRASEGFGRTLVEAALL